MSKERKRRKKTPVTALMSPITGSMKPGTDLLRIEKYVRGKNNQYVSWRKDKKHEALDDWCSECLMRFGTLPHWGELSFTFAYGAPDWKTIRAYEVEQREWRNKIKGWCYKQGITKFWNQGAQFYKYYSAWYRVKWENQHGPITWQMGRQMY